MEKFKCGYCRKIISRKDKKIPDEIKDKIEKAKQKTEEKYKEFLEKRKNLTFWKRFKGFLVTDFTIHWLRIGDFDTWLFISEEHSWDKKRFYEHRRNKTLCTKCPNCNGFNLFH